MVISSSFGPALLQPCRMTISAVLLSFAIIFWMYFLWLRRKFYAFAFKMPGPFGLPLIGILHRIWNLQEILYIIPKIAAEYKTKTMFTWLGPYPILYTMEPKILEIILNSPDCINKSKLYDVFEDALGAGILTSKSPTWNNHRKLLNPAFAHKVLLSFFPKFNKISRDVCEKLDKLVGCDKVNVRELTFSLSMNTSIATTMGCDLSETPNFTLLKDFERLLELTANRMLTPWLRASFIYKRLNIYKYFIQSKNNIVNFVHDIVTMKMKLLEEETREEKNQDSILTKEHVDIKREKNIFIDQAIAIHQTNEFTLDDVQIESNLIVFGATETTATALFSTLMYLAMYPEYQRRVIEEIYAAFPDTEFDVNYEDFKNLTYLDMCINETLRCSPGFPLIGRVTSNDVPISKDLVIPRGTQIFIDIFNTHRDKDIWGPEADTFDPDHFLPYNSVRTNSYSFLPFSKGPRKCIGWQYARMVMKVALVQILRRYRFTTKYNYKDLRFEENVALKYTELPHLEVHRR